MLVPVLFKNCKLHVRFKTSGTNRLPMSPDGNVSPQPASLRHIAANALSPHRWWLEQPRSSCDVTSVTCMTARVKAQEQRLRSSSAPRWPLGPSLRTLSGEASIMIIHGGSHGCYCLWSCFDGTLASSVIHIVALYGSGLNRKCYLDPKGTDGEKWERKVWAQARASSLFLQQSC